MTNKSEESAKLEETETSKAFEEAVVSPIVVTTSSVVGSTDSGLETPSLPNRTTRSALGSKRMAESLEGKSGKRKGTNNLRESASFITTEAPLPKVAAPIVVKLEETAARTSGIKTTTVDTKLLGSKDRTIFSSTPHNTFCDKEDIDDNDDDDGEFVFTIKPLMGEPFTITLIHDSTVFDLKDSIFTRLGMAPEMQLLSLTTDKENVTFEDEDLFLADMKIPRKCTLNLMVKVATGLQLFHETCMDNDEFFFYEVIPQNDKENVVIDSSSPELVDDGTNTEGSTAIVTIDGPVLPSLPALHSYLNLKLNNCSKEINVEDELGTKLSFHVEGLEALKISASDEEFDPKLVPERPTTPFEVKPEPVKEPAGPARCHECGKRCRLAAQFQCRCGHKFCSEHRYYDKHCCTFDHKSHDRSKLSFDNPRVYKPTLEQL